MATWLVYLVRNREIIGLEVADEMIRKVVIMSAINVALCNSLPIDDWYVLILIVPLLNSLSV